MLVLNLNVFKEVSFFQLILYYYYIFKIQNNKLLIYRLMLHFYYITNNLINHNNKILAILNSNFKKNIKLYRYYKRNLTDFLQKYTKYILK